MTETFDDIVDKWYDVVRDEFTAILMDRYKDANITLDDVKNIYQDVFVEIHRITQRNIVAPDGDWHDDIIRLGLDLADRKYRVAGRSVSFDATKRADIQRLPATAQEIAAMLKYIPIQEEEQDLFTDPAVQAILRDELMKTPEPYASIINWTYYYELSDEEIAQYIDPDKIRGRRIAINAMTVRVRRVLGLRNLMYRVKLALYNAELIYEKPEMRFT